MTSQGVYCPGIIQPRKQNHKLKKVDPKKVAYSYVIYIVLTIHISCRFWASKTAKARRNGVETRKSRDKSSKCDAYVTCDDVRCFSYVCVFFVCLIY